MSDNQPQSDAPDVADVAGAVEAAQRLREAVSRAGGATAASRRSGVSRYTLNNYLAGREMRRGVMVALADACGVRLEWLATGRGPMDVNQLAASITVTPTGDVEGEPFTLKAYNYLPIAKYDVRASAGSGNIVPEEPNKGYFALEDTFLRQTLRRRREDLVCIEAAGDSMEPAIHDGDLLVIDTTVTEIQSSRVYVLNINGELLVKRLSLRLDGAITVRSDNPRYPEEIVKPSERTTLRIVGQVVYQAGPVRS